MRASQAQRPTRWVALLALAALFAGPAASAPATPRDGHGLKVESVKKLNDRLLEVVVTTDKLPHPATMRILLPSGYSSHPRTRYPVLYLFHGTSGGAADWTTMGDAERTTTGLPLIVVMPDAGYHSDGGGWFTNWFNDGRFGPPEWETFHIDQLIPWIDSNLRTVAARRGRAIIGLSQGGFGAMSYAARHPDRFISAASFSGAVDIAANGLIADPLVTPIIIATAVGLDHAPPDAMFGNRATQEINWATHDPATLVGNLRGMNLYLYTGDGRAGPFDPPVANPTGSLIESGVHTLTQLFHQELLTHGIPSAYHDYGAGTHSWRYWARDLRQVIGPLMDDFSHPRPPPSAIEYLTAGPRYHVWGWSVVMHRRAIEFSRIQGADATGFALSGSGASTVTTPAVYEPRSVASIREVGDNVDRTVSRRVGSDGRVRVEVELGRANPDQQYTAAASLNGTRVYTTTVRIKAPARRARRR